MQMNELSAGPLLKSAWQKFKSNWLNLTGVLLLIVAIQTVLGLIAEIGNEGFAFFMSIIIFAAGIIMGMGFLNITIKIGRGDDFEIADLFGTIAPFFKYLGGTLLYGLIFYIGLILLVIPGIIWGIKFCLTPYFIIDRDMGPIEALKASSRTTQGYKWNLFGIFIIFFGVAILGFILFVIGIIPASLTIGIGNALIYLYLSDNRKEPAKSESEV